MVDEVAFSEDEETREQQQNQQIQLLLDRVNQLEERLDDVTEALMTLTVKQSNELMVAAAGLKQYKAEIVRDESQVTDKTYYCTVVDTGLEIQCGEAKLDIHRMAPAARRAIEKAVTEVEDKTHFQLNLYVMR